MNTFTYFNEIANRFIDNLSGYTDYNVNIMNEKGIIIASKNKKRIGSYHEISYKMIEEKKEILYVEPNEEHLGTKNGINMLLKFNNEIIGVIGITGIPEEVKNIALILKMSLETMLEYELSKQVFYKHKASKEFFINCLIRSDVGNDEIYELAKRLNYKDNIYRIPIIIRFEEKLEIEILEEGLRQIKESGLHLSQDISCVLNNRDIVIFKSFEIDKDRFFKDYKYLIKEYLSSYLRWALKNNINSKFYVGSIQNKFEKYSHSYYHAKWLSNNIKTTKKGIFFYEYLSDFFISRIAFTDVLSIFEPLRQFIDEKIEKNIIDIIPVLNENDYNFKNSSEQLFIHRNTLNFRLNKIKDYFSSNPVKNNREREFLNYLCYYLLHI
ncbi:CdaR family transcriptional regulator [Defluviitalea phaphyphila]|uniref:CdaR family transcriptional regulator n=1 Tax=Defluviitalea phaphyphila TaxID=1473580 RepID=UPI00072FFEFA|nr:sugar diacid recognition domain-containing protein [Defluviitalea phaphyphila]